MWFGIITLFPETFSALQAGITGRALNNGLLAIEHWNPRDFCKDKHKCVDDRPYGGGPGMVMMVEPLQAAIQAAKEKAPSKPTVVFLSPQGKQFTQEAAVEFTAKKAVILIAGRYEGVDQRLIDLEVDEEWSIGDYILTGGELAAMVIIDTITRLIPGAVGDQDSVAQDSITTGLLKYPQYTRPENFAGLSVPEVLLSGNHKLIEEWRLKQSVTKTQNRRPDLILNKEKNKKVF